MPAPVAIPPAPGPTEIKVFELDKVLSRSPSPNRGSSLPDLQVIGPDRTTKEEWRQARGIDPSTQVRIVKLSHMRYQHPDLSEITQFLRDFGLHVTKKTESERWFRGYGPDQYIYYVRQGPKAFLGGTFEVESFGDLKKVGQIPSVKVVSDGIEEMLEAPGKGHIITIEDPEGFPVNFVHGQSMTAALGKPLGRLVFNDESEKPRQRMFQRFEPGPAEVYKLGHFGLVVSNFASEMKWYTRHFNIIPSDILYIPVLRSPEESGERKEVAMFAHIDRGEDLVDHHTLFLTSATSGLERHVHHCSFEVHDFDTQALGHQWLAQKGYKSVWGVGRHILGSQIFDYWWDTTGNMVEHYADGDLVNIETPMAFGPAGHEGLAVWGPEVPNAFLN